MAKKRKSVFSTDTPKEEVAREAKAIEKKALQGQEEKPQGRAGLKNLYVDHDHHIAAKIRAAQRGMKLGEYIEWLIDQDKA